jgi:serine/threonine protein kinase
LLLYDAESEECLFLNARRGKGRTEYLCYTSGRTLDRPDLGTERCRLLARLLGMALTETQAEDCASRAEAAEPAGEPEESSPARRLLGEFQLLSELGRGGMGVVYRAWQPSLGRQVAVKKLLHGGDPRMEARFQREIRALGKVEHPNLVKVFTSGADGDQWFYAMELVEGATLAAVCTRLQSRATDVTAVDLRTWQDNLSEACAEARRAERPCGPEAADLSRGADAPPADVLTRSLLTAGPTYIEQVVELMRQVAKAAHALHEAGVIHRDIKPGNILVTPDGSQAVLMDLGLAQLADEAEGALTHTRQFVGTLRYASPQQVLAVARLDRRTDIYSLGATLWELLTLRPLYGATEGTPPPELMERIQRRDPEPVRRFNRRVPRDLEAIVLRCLEKDPARRYATARELADDLRRFRSGQPVQARRRTWGYVLGKYLHRHRAAAVLAGAAALALAAAYLLLADAGAGLPGGEPARDLLDHYGASVFRPVARDADVRRASAALRRELFDVLKQSRSPGGWFPRELRSPDEHQEVWTHCQSLYAVLRTPEASKEELHDLLPALDLPFEPGRPVEVNGVKYGWLARPPEEQYTVAEAALWTAAALAAALGRPRLLEGEARQAALDHYRYTQEVLRTYRPDEAGGWNMHPNQQDPGDHSPYTTALALLALLEARRAGLAWEGSAGRRDELLRAAAQWLVDAYDAAGDPPGWHVKGLSTYRVFDGLTLQVYTLLLRAREEADFPVPREVLDNIPRHLEHCTGRGLDFEGMVAKPTVPYTDHTGQARFGKESITFLWYPWAIACSAQWLQSADGQGASWRDRLRVRRALAHLVVGLGPDGVTQARSDWTFFCSEMLLGLETIPPDE